MIRSTTIAGPQTGDRTHSLDSGRHSFSHRWRFAPCRGSYQPHLHLSVPLLAPESRIATARQRDAILILLL